jgi:putative phosphoesterase
MSPLHRKTARVDTASLRIGLISDTHGLLRPEALAFLQGCHGIIHGGDIGDATILSRLGEIAPVHAVRGNNDIDAWSEAIPETRVVRVDSVGIYVIHDLGNLRIDPQEHGLRAVVSGHSHQPRILETGSVLFVNPGSAGRRRFRLPVSIGELLITRGRIEARLHQLPG